MWAQIRGCWVGVGGGVISPPMEGGKTGKVRACSGGVGRQEQVGGAQQGGGCGSERGKSVFNGFLRLACTVVGVFGLSCFVPM